MPIKGISPTQIGIAIFVTTLIVLLLLASVILTILLARRKAIKQQVFLAETRLSYEKELRQVENEVSEHMMERFAQELHDNIGHILTIIRLQIENRKLDQPELEPTFLPIEHALNKATEQLRMLSRSLNSDYVSNIGLEEAIQLEIERLRQLGRLQIHWDFKVPKDNLDRNQKLMVFRIFQEILNNIIKHSKAKNILVFLYPQDDLCLTVEDDGQGFIPGEVINSSKASGLRNMMKRARLAGMECVIESSPGAGCLYTL